jgi:hypothetical protein
VTPGASSISLNESLRVSVVFDHAAPAEELLVGGQIAVQCF